MPGSDVQTVAMVPGASLEGDVSSAEVFVGADVVAEGELVVPLALANGVNVDVDVGAFEVVAEEEAKFTA